MAVPAAAGSRTLPERPPISAPRRPCLRETSGARSERFAGQPGLGLIGLTMVVPVLLFLGLGWGGAERSLLVLGPMSTFALPLIAMIAFWWEDWPGTMLRAPLAGLADTVLVAMGGVLLTVAGQALVGNVDLRGVFDPGAVSGQAPTFPATMPVAGAVFVAMLELTLVSEGWPLRRLNRYAGGLIALVAAWAIGVGLYLALVDFQPAAGSGLHARHGPVAGAQLGAALVCIGVLQVGFFVVLRGWPFAGIGSRALRLASANAAVLGGGCLAYLALAGLADIEPALISAGAGSVVASGLVVGMLFEGAFDARLAAGRARLANFAAVAVLAAVIYLGLTAFADTARWTRAEPEEWIAFAGLNALGAGVILHVAIGRRWPFAR